MALTVRLGPESERALNRMARKKGVSRSDVVRDAIARYAAETDGPAEGTPFGQWADVLGIVSLGARDPNLTTGEQFAAALTARPRRRRRAR